SAHIDKGWRQAREVGHSRRRRIRRDIRRATFVAENSPPSRAIAGRIPYPDPVILYGGRRLVPIVYHGTLKQLTQQARTLAIPRKKRRTGREAATTAATAATENHQP